jgi:hypothetical protein
MNSETQNTIDKMDALFDIIAKQTVKPRLNEWQKAVIRKEIRDLREHLAELVEKYDEV